MKEGHTRINQLGIKHLRSLLSISPNPHHPRIFSILRVHPSDLQGINLSSGSIPPLFPCPASFHNLLYLPKCHIVRPNNKKNPTMTGMKVRPVCVGERDLAVKTIGVGIE
jgi:hypothetical protein